MPALVAVLVVLASTLSLVAFAGHVEDRGATIDQFLPAHELEQQARAMAAFRGGVAEDERLVVVLQGASDAWSDARVAALGSALEGVSGVASARPEAGLAALASDAALRFVVLELEPGTARLERARALVAACDDVLAAERASGERAYVLGMPRLRADSWRLARGDLFRVLPVLLVLAFVIPWIFLGSWTAGLFASLMATTTTALTLWSFFALCGPPSSLVLLVVPILWAGATMDAMHLVARARIHRVDALRRARSELLAPCLVTTLTTAAGLCTLGLASASSLLRNLGLVSGAGIVVAYAVTFLLGPPLLALLPAGRAPRWPVAVGVALMRRARRRPRLWIGAWTTLVLGALALLPALRVANPFPRVFSPGVAIGADLEHFARALGTDLNPIDVVLTATDDAGRRPTVLVSAALVAARELRSLPSVRAVLPFDAFDAALLEDTRGADPRERERRLGDALARDELRPWIDAGGARARVQVHLAPATQAEKRGLFERLARLDQSMLVHHELRPAGVGYSVFRVEELGLENLKSGGPLTLLALGVLLALGMRRRDAGPYGWLLAVVVSAVPLLLTAAMLVVTSTPWSLLLLPLPGVLLGLALDDSVHLLWRPRGAGGTLRALPAVLATTLLVAACVATLAWTSFVTNRAFGLLLAFGLVTALAADLTLLPALVRRSRRR